MPELLGFARAIHVAMSLSLFGVFLFRAAIAPATIERLPLEAARCLDKRLHILAAISLVTALVSAIPWLLQQALAMSGAHDLAGAAQALVPVLLQTQFGHVFLGRVALLLAVTFCLWPHVIGQRRWATLLGTALSGAAVLLLAATGHVAAMEGSGRLVSTLVQAAHLAAAGAWLGSLAPLALALTLPTSAAIVAVQRFSPLGIGCVSVLAATAWFTSQELVGSVPALLGTPYGHWALAKLALFAAMIALALANRLLLTPSLAHNDAPAARHLRLSIAAEITLGLAVVMAAGMLAATPPGVHAQPWWPLPFRLSLIALQEQPQLFGTLSLAVVASAAGLLLIFTGAQYRRWRWPVLATGVALIAAVAPSFRPLAVDAFPTTFWRSPIDYSAQSVASGAQLFARYCSGCHGPQGRGGPETSSLSNKPRDDHADGDVFWWISHGLTDRGMPGFAETLDETARWSLIDFIHATTDAARLTGSVAQGPIRRVPAPNFTVECSDGAVVTLKDLLGRGVHLIFAGPGSAERLRQLAAIETVRQAGGIMTVIVAQGARGEATEPFCEATTPEIAEAYAVFDGSERAAAGIEGTEFLIDAAGVLRAVGQPAKERHWVDPLASSEIERMGPAVIAPLPRPDAH